MRRSREAEKQEAEITKLKRLFSLSLCLSASLLLSTTLAFAGTQRFFEAAVAPNLKAVWVVVDDFPAREEQAQQALREASTRAAAVLERLDPLNPSSEIAVLLAKINSHGDLPSEQREREGEAPTALPLEGATRAPIKEPGTFAVSPDLAKILATIQEVAKAMDEVLANKIKVDLEKNEVKLKTVDVTINIEPVLKGYLADLMMNDLNQAGFTNSFLELGGVFVARGSDFNGPWKIEVADPTTENAHHAFLYKVSDTAAATIHFQNPVLGIPNSDIQSVTIFTKRGACQAQGLATAVYAMGLGPAQKFLKEAEVDRAVLIDLSGKFYQFPEKE